MLTERRQIERHLEKRKNMIPYDSGKVLLAKTRGREGLNTKWHEGTFGGDANPLYVNSHAITNKIYIYIYQMYLI